MKRTLIGAGLTALVAAVPVILRWWFERRKDDDSNDHVKSVRDAYGRPVDLRRWDDE